MSAIVTSTASVVKAACANGSCSLGRSTAKVAVARRTTRTVSRATTTRTAQPVRRGGCANGQCRI